MMGRRFKFKEKMLYLMINFWLLQEERIEYLKSKDLIKLTSIHLEIKKTTSISILLLENLESRMLLLLEVVSLVCKLPLQLKWVSKTLMSQLLLLKKLHFRMYLVRK